MDSTSADFIIPLFNWGHNSGRCIALIGHAHAVVSTFLPWAVQLTRNQGNPSRTNSGKKKTPLERSKIFFWHPLSHRKKKQKPFLWHVWLTALYLCDALKAPTITSLRSQKWKYRICSAIKSSFVIHCCTAQFCFHAIVSQYAAHTQSPFHHPFGRT